MCYNGSMNRLNVLKGIEGILVEKAYEVGHISHRKGGDWQKQADGSWTPYTGEQSNQNKKDSAPTKSTGHDNAVKQDFESAPDSVKDKMFTIAQQYQSEWAEDSDEDVRSMAEGDVEDLAQKLWDTADEETRNSWLGDLDTSSTEIEDVENPTPVQGTEWTGEPMSTEDVQYEVDRISKVDPSGTGWIIKNPTPAKLDKQAEKMTDSFMEYFSGEVGVDVDRADLKNRVLQKMNELNGVQKSAVRDMRFVPVTKNMGF